MKVSENVVLNPISTEKSLRGEEIRHLTSCKAGQIVPLKYIPILREDSVRRGAVRIALDMAETIHPLMNAVNVTAYVHFVPYLMLDRFKDLGMASLNRSYQKEPEPYNSTVIPFIQTHAFDRNIPFYKALGIHWPQGAQINSAPWEMFRGLVNWRRQQRSASLPDWTTTNTTLPAAFWKNGDMTQVVPSFDQAAIDGEVPLTFATPKLRISGIGKANGTTPVSTAIGVNENGIGNKTYANAVATGASNLWFESGPGGVPSLYAELSKQNVSISLANIEVAKQTAAFARLRDRYSGLDDDHIIDLLMEGIRVPDEALKQPILLDRKSTIFGYSERHAMDGASLDRSVTTGKTSLDLNFRLPPMNGGGIIFISLEIVPEQLFERKRDKFLGITDPDQFPNFLRDYLDPEKVDVVQNSFPDVMHANPSGVFGYAPLNHEWKRTFATIGGKFYRPTPDSFVEDRQRFWAVEQLNPSLTADFYLCNNLPHSVFMDTLSDPFEVLCTGGVSIMGNTVFGKAIDEDNGSYGEILSQVDLTRIDQTP